jgi:hypothetical protein
MNLPPDLGQKIHFQGTIETPNDFVRFFCGSYIMHDSIITIYDFLLDASSTHKAPFLQKGVMYHEKMEIIGYMAVFTPYTPPAQMKGGETQ